MRNSGMEAPVEGSRRMTAESCTYATCPRFSCTGTSIPVRAEKRLMVTESLRHDNRLNGFEWPCKAYLPYDFQV